LYEIKHLKMALLTFAYNAGMYRWLEPLVEATNQMNAASNSAVRR